MSAIRIVLATLLAGALSSATVARAADVVVMMPVEEGLNQYRAQLGDSVRFYFGRTPPPKVLERIAPITINKRTNAFKRTNEVCHRAFLSALLALQDRARKLNANAVITISSYFNQVEVWSDSQFECHRSELMAGVGLQGVIARVAR